MTKWKSINPAFYTPVAMPRSWSQTAVECYESNKNCEQCPTYWITERAWTSPRDRRCKMPLAVQKLLNAKLPVPESISFLRNEPADFGGHG